MFRYIGGCAAIFATQGQALHQSQEQNEQGRCHTNAAILRHATNGKGRPTHQDQGEQKGVFPADNIAQSPED